MPLYEYQCPKCGVFELIRKFSDELLTACPTCGREVQKLASAPAFHLKGTGWYVTDYAKKSPGDNKAGKGKSDESKSGDSKSSDSKSSESKSSDSKSGERKPDSRSGDSSKSAGGDSAKSSKDASSAKSASTSKKTG